MLYEGHNWIFDWLVADLNSEQIRAYALFFWIISGIWFLLGIFIPELRFVSTTP